MSGAGFILLINLAIAGLFCASFVLIAAYDGRYVSARWFAAAYVMGMVYATLEFLLPAFTDVKVGVFLGHVAFLCALLLLNVGLAHRYETEPPRRILTTVVVASLLAAALLQDLPRGSLLRNFLYQGPFFLMQAVGLVIVLRASATRAVGRRPIDTLLMVFLGLSALHYLTKPLFVIMLGGSGARPQDYLATTYAMVSQSTGTVLVVATALLLLAMLIMDMVRDITTRSETDLLSGLLNRRGFEERLGDIVSRLPANGLPISLVICDLDHFKKVNDTYGHAAGDKVIAGFAATLRESAAGHHVLGRIGGEEFAVLLPGSNLAAGRLFAETVRAAFAGRGMEGFPAEKVFTASFGVAELEPAEAPAALMARADIALYQAKGSGRDCVRVSRARAVGHAGGPASLAS